MGMTDYLSRHPSETKGNASKIKAKELWHNWFTVNEIQNKSFVSDNKIQWNEKRQPMRGELPITGEPAVSAKTTREGKLAKVNTQTIKQIAAIIAKPQQRNSIDS